MIYQIAAACILTLLYGCYFLKILLLKKKGIQMNHIGKGKGDGYRMVEGALEASVCITFLIEMISIYENTTIFPTWVRIAGGCIALTGVILFSLSAWTMADNWRIGVLPWDKTELVTKGIYRFSRNPAFFGFDLVCIGILLMFWNYSLLFVTLLAMYAIHQQIVCVEEILLKTTFGGAYVDYKESVCRYFGR